MKYDLELFLALNEEFKDKPLVPAPPLYDEGSLAKRAQSKIDRIARRANVTGKRVIEIGCGRGEVVRSLVETKECTAVGVDIRSYPHWETKLDGLEFKKRDLGAQDNSDLGRFDVAYSNSVWEHLPHPYAMLKAVYGLLKPGGRFVLSANLYRGPMASHRYRDIYFPWPHLLFSDEVVAQFYRHKAGLEAKQAPEAGSPKQPVRDKTVAWVNELSIADYHRYFDLVGFRATKVSFSKRALDDNFIERFADKLDRFPRYDLERDFIHTTLVKPRFGGLFSGVSSRRWKR